MTSVRPHLLRSAIAICALAAGVLVAPVAAAAPTSAADPASATSSPSPTVSARPGRAPAVDPADEPVVLLTPTVQVSSTLATYGAAGSVTVTITGPDAGEVPTGTVSVTRTSDGAVVGSASLVDGGATVPTPAGWDVGTHAVEVSYSGDTVYAAATAAGSVQVDQADASISASALPQRFPAAGGVAVTVVGPGATAPSGQVQVQIGASTWTGVLSAGTVTVPTGTRAPGEYQMTVRYLGDARHRATDVSGRTTVDRAQVTVVSAVSQVGSYGGSARVSVKVTGPGRTVTGQVFVVNGSRRVTGTLVGGVATLVVPTDWVGSRTVRTGYAGDPWFGPAERLLVVTSGRARTGLSAGSATTSYGVGPTFRVTVAGAGSRPSGVISLLLDGRLIGTGALRSGAAAVTTSVRPAPGTRRLTVRYGGSATHAGSTATATWTVTKASPTVRSSATAATVTSRARVAVRVSGLAAGPSGRVEVRSGYRVLARATLSRGAATVVLPVLGVGSHRLTVAYTGDTRFRAATTAVVVPITRARSFGNGLFRVGIDIPAGLYRVNAGESLCYWELRTDAGDSVAGIISNDIGYGYRLVEIRASDRYVRSNRCGTWRLVSETANLPFRSGRIPGDGLFLVGKDVATGTYAQYGDDCYVASLSDGRGSISSIIDNYYIDPGERITWRIDSTDFAFETSGCGTWYKVG